MNIAALASGAGTNVSAILAAIRRKQLDARLALVLSNNPDAPVLKTAEEEGLAVWSREHKKFADRGAYDREMLAAIRKSGAETIVLAGYMRLLSPFLVRAFPGRILNVHPALLPSFPGMRGVGEALSSGARLTGATVHFVEETPDSGPIIIQAALPISSEDSENDLLRRIHALEHRIYPQALQWLAEGRLKIENRRTRLLPGKKFSGEAVSCGRDDLGAWLVSPGLEGF
ncbi:MAG: phosphoribosylglycinamide formyltransferase [Desulfarculales bacterium]|nr:phosphoribosylglycinamide formyltransferase [Desulfarculales bacterium]